MKSHPSGYQNAASQLNLPEDSTDFGCIERIPSLVEQPFVPTEFLGLDERLHARIGDNGMPASCGMQSLTGLR